MRKRSVVVSDDAVTDIEDARAFYERLESGLGEYFTACLVADLESLAFFAGIHSIWFGYHRMLCKRFPFAVYYEVIEDIVMVVAVLDMRRNPAAIKKKLESTGP
jgi:hypothetical protein